MGCGCGGACGCGGDSHAQELEFSVEEPLRDLSHLSDRLDAVERAILALAVENLADNSL